MDSFLRLLANLLTPPATLTELSPKWIFKLLKIKAYSVSSVFRARKKVIFGQMHNVKTDPVHFLSPNTLMPKRVCVVYLASPIDTFHSGSFSKIYKAPKIQILIESLRQLPSSLKKYPVIVFHEDYRENEFQLIRKSVDVRSIQFQQVNFKIYKGCSVDSYVKKNNTVLGRPMGYRMMCRFFSGAMQNHPCLRDFDYYIRMDHDSFMMKPYFDDLESLIYKYQFDYLYRSVFYDNKEADALWKFTLCYSSLKNLGLQGFSGLEMIGNDGAYNGRCPYNNFHISSLAFWRRPDVQDFLREVENVDGILCGHWQDANIHAMLLGLFKPCIVEKVDFGYRHNTHYSLARSNRIQFIPSAISPDFP